MRVSRKKGLAQLQRIFMETFGFGPAVALTTIIVIFLLLVFAVFWFFYSAPPGTITISTGPPGSVFEMFAKRYSGILASQRVKLKIINSQGSLENLQRLLNKHFDVDVAFVQGGIAGNLPVEKLESLGSVSYEPLVIFYRNPKPIGFLSDFSGKRLAIGPEGSGTRSLALILLKANGIEPGSSTALLNLDAADAAEALLSGKVDAAFMMGDSASPQVMLKLLRTDGVRMLNFVQADGYTRRFVYLNKLALPEGSIDFGQNIPSEDVWLIGPTVELIARPDLHPALCDLLIEAATQVHGKASLLKRQGEFPAPLEHEFPISSEAARFYKSGKSFLYRNLPFWVASLATRVLVAFVPLVVVLIPVLRFIPVIYNFRIRLRIYRWYRLLLTLEQELIASSGKEQQTSLHARLDKIEEDVNRMKVPASFGDQFYVLRQHIRFVHSRLKEGGVE